MDELALLTYPVLVVALPPHRHSSPIMISRAVLHSKQHMAMERGNFAGAAKKPAKSSPRGRGGPAKCEREPAASNPKPCFRV